jgi:hypothetical protein
LTLPCGSVSATTSANLLLGGDGEAGACTSDWKAVTTVPGWTTVQGNPAIVCYSIASFSTPGALAQGNAFIADGPYGDSALMQTIDVSAAGVAIDGGTVSYTLSGWLGGWGVYGGQAVVTANFLDIGGHLLGSAAQLPAVSAADRGYRNAFVARTLTNGVPAGTRAIEVMLRFINTSGSYNVGYADNLSLTLSTNTPASVLTAPASTVPALDHVFLVMMENTDYAAVAGSANAPFINSLAAGGVLLTQSSGTYHPSDENYLAIAGGANFVQGAIYFPNIHVNSAHLGDRLEAVGKTWKGYAQGMGTPCNTTSQYDSYFMADDLPFINFTNLQNDNVRCRAHLVDLGEFVTDLQATSTTPNFAWLAADDYYDGEAAGNGSAASVRVQDDWLRQTLQPLFNSAAWRTQRSLLIVTWDESASSGNNHIATVLAGSPGLLRAGYRSPISYNHYSVGRTIESALGLSALTPNDRYAEPINDAFAASVVPVGPQLTTSTSSVPRGANVVFDYLGSTQLSSTNWIGIYPAGIQPGTQNSIMWQYAPDADGRATFSTSQLAAGRYAAWYCHDDGYSVLAGPITFDVVTP